MPTTPTMPTIPDLDMEYIMQYMHCAQVFYPLIVFIIFGIRYAIPFLRYPLNDVSNIVLRLASTKMAWDYVQYMEGKTPAIVQVCADDIIDPSTFMQFSQEDEGLYRLSGLYTLKNIIFGHTCFFMRKKLKSACQVKARILQSIFEVIIEHSINIAVGLFAQFDMHILSNAATKQKVSFVLLNVCLQAYTTASEAMILLFVCALSRLALLAFMLASLISQYYTIKKAHENYSKEKGAVLLDAVPRIIMDFQFFAILLWTAQTKLLINYEQYQQNQIRRRAALRTAPPACKRNGLRNLFARIKSWCLKAEQNQEENQGQNQDAVGAPIAAQRDEADNKVSVPDNRTTRAWLRYRAR